MKRFSLNTKSTKFIPLTVALAAAALFAIGSHAKADVPAEFTGNNGNNFSITLTSPVSYTITTTSPSGSSPRFIFQNTGDIFSGSTFDAHGNMTFSINGGTSNVIVGIGTGSTGGGVSSNDLFFYGNPTGLSIGDIVTLSAGTPLTAYTNGTVPPPPNGNYRTFIADSQLNVISKDGVTAVPEPSAFLLFGIGGLALLFFRKRLIHSA